MTLSTNQELLNFALFNGQEPTDGSSDYATEIVNWYNWGFRTILEGGNEFLQAKNPDWWWLNKEGNLILQPTYDTGTVSVTNNSNAITFSASITDSMAGRHFRVENTGSIYKISAHTAGTDTGTLDSVYTEDTNSAANYKLMKLDYDLASDVLAITGSMKPQGGGEIIHADPSEIEQRYPLYDVQSGTPKLFGMLSETSVRFSHYGETEDNDFIRVDYDYIYRPSDLANDSNEPPIPLQYRHVLSDLALFKLLLDKEDSRATDIGAQAKGTINAMINRQNALMGKSGRIGHIYTRPNHRNQTVTTASGLRIL